MSTALQLAQKLRQQTIDSGTGPSTIVSQTGELGRIVTWTVDAYTDIQNDRDDWLWLRKSFYVDTVASDGEYAYSDCTDTVTAAVISRFARWYKASFKAYLSSAGVGAEYPLRWMEWDDFRRIYRYGTQTDSQPVYVSMDPTMKFCIGPKPSAVYRVSGDYQKGPQTLALDADEPEMPSRFHDLIVYRAMVKYGFNRVAPEALSRAQLEGGRLNAALVRNQTPGITVGASLA